MGLVRRGCLVGRVLLRLLRLRSIFDCVVVSLLTADSKALLGLAPGLTFFMGGADGAGVDLSVSWLRFARC